jgi:hypothetical protein
VLDVSNWKYTFTSSAKENSRRDHLEDIGIDRKIILEWIIGKYGRKVQTGCIWFPQKAENLLAI